MEEIAWDSKVTGKKNDTEMTAWGSQATTSNNQVGYIINVSLLFYFFKFGDVFACIYAVVLLDFISFKF